MAKIDNELTKKVKVFLAKPEHTVEEIQQGALVLLQLNRNKPLYNTIMQRPQKFEAKVVYELKKFLPSREDGLTIEEVVEMEKELMPEISSAICAAETVKDDYPEDPVVMPYRSGKRQDHDQLPEDIKAIWPKNAERWKKIKELYNTVEELSDPCEKYEHLKAMKEAWYQYKADFNRYDEYQVGSGDDTNVGSNENVQTVTDQKAVNNARSYIAKNVPVLAELQKAGDEEKANVLRERITERVNLLIATHQEFKQETIDNLLGVGIGVENLMNPADDE